MLWWTRSDIVVDDMAILLWTRYRYCGGSDSDVVVDQIAIWWWIRSDIVVDQIAILLWNR
jgi:hypothetical protein